MFATVAVRRTIRVLLSNTIARAPLPFLLPAAMAAALRQPVIFMPHGGGPCFQLPEGTFGPPGTWTPMRRYLESIQPRLPRTPDAIVVCVPPLASARCGWRRWRGRLQGAHANLPNHTSLTLLPFVHLTRLSAHWEETSHTVFTSPSPPLLFDYYGFPPEAYQLSWPAPGAPAVAERVQRLLSAAGLPSTTDARRGYDHGVFVPMLVAFPDASVPTTQVSLLSSLDPAAHVALGKALAPLRDDNILILGSGFSFHNLGSMRVTLLSGANPGGAAADKVRSASKAFDGWLVETLCSQQLDPAQREQRILAWATAPHGACMCVDAINLPSR